LEDRQHDVEPADNEILIDVRALNVDAASFTQIKQAVGATPEAIASCWASWPARQAAQPGHRFGRHAHRHGERHRPGAGRQGGSGAGRPHRHAGVAVAHAFAHRRIKRRALERDQIDVQGQAILFATGLFARLPADIPEKMALAILDVAGAPAQTARLVHAGDTVVVIGGGGKSGTLCVYEGASAPALRAA
jgi:L-erythro-3,5-diaminohexanoate dehydrogenase